MIHICVYRGARAPEPVAQDDFATWDEFAEELEAMANLLPECSHRLPPEEQKLHLLAWSPHRLSIPYRKLENVTAVTLLVLDVDRVLKRDGDALDALLQSARAVLPQGLIYESPSSTPAAPRVRVVAPVSREIAPADCRATRFALANALGLLPGCGVEGAIDAAKLFFAGRLYATPERKVWKW